ncbi:hypothetical protein, partial [Acetobacter senegalensis]
TATAPGTGSFTLNGPETARRSFSAAFPNGGTVFYFADDGSSAEWGVGTLTIGTPSTLSRTTIIGTTSGSASALNFSGSVEVYNEIPAEYVPILEADGHLIVKSITDWTQRQALGAADAEGRYVKSVNDSTNIRIDGAGINKQTGVPWLHTGSGFSNLQMAGDYATNAAVNAEVTARVNAVAGLDAAKVNRAGDAMRGALSTFNDPNLTNGVYNYSPGFRTFTNTRSGFQFFAQDKVGDGSTASGVFALEWNGIIQQYWWLNPDGSIGQSSKGNVAFVSQIPTDIYSGTSFNNDFATSDDRIINLPYGNILQCFRVDNVSSGRISFPRAFSAAPQSIIVQAVTGGVIAHYHCVWEPDASGFTLNLYGSYDAIYVEAKGKK